MKQWVTRKLACLLAGSGCGSSSWRFSFPFACVFQGQQPSGTFCNTSGVRRRKHIGTNSFSTVIRWLKSTDPTYKQRLSGLWYNIPLTVRPAWVERWVLARPAQDDYRRATCVLALLGEKADSIQPQLLKLTYSHSRDVVRRALVVLRSWARKVLPQLVQVACDPTHPCRPEILAE